MVVYGLGITTLIPAFFLAYKLDFDGAIYAIFTTNAGWINLGMLFLLSLIYYTFESATEIGIGSSIFGFQVVTKYVLPPTRFFILLSIRNLVKSFFLSNAFNAAFVLVFRRNMQTLLDHTFDVVLATNKDELAKSFGQGFAASMIMYYGTFVMSAILFALEKAGSPTTSTTPVNSSNPAIYSTFYSVLNNNLLLDVIGYMLGGLTFLLGTFVRLFTSNILDAYISVSLINGSGLYTFGRYVLPQFFPETMGYVFGIAVAISATDILLYLVQSLIRNEEKGYFIKRSKIQLENLVYYSILSILFIIIGAIIEALIGA